MPSDFQQTAICSWCCSLENKFKNIREQAKYEGFDEITFARHWVVIVTITILYFP